MKKTNRMKKAVMVMMAAGMLCACGNNEQSASRGSIGDAPEPKVTTEPTIQEPIAQEPGTTTEPDNDPVTGGIVTAEVEGVSVRYYNGYNIATGDIISDTIPCNTVEVSGDALTGLSEILPELSAITENSQSEEYGHIMYDHLMDYYELTINDDLVLDIGDEYGVCKSTGEVFQVPAELYDIVNEIAEENNKNNVYATLDTDQITVTDQDGRELEITDPDQLKTLLSVEYYPINAEDEMFEGEKVAYVMDLHNGDELDVYFASVLGRLRHADGSYEYVHIQEMEDHLNRIFAE